VSFEQAWAMASTQPAELIGLPAPPDVTVDVGKDGFARR
jgi:alpha-D-ribose 1-methylphosphonate 5-triphosphate diphosphatase PhnM